jgi:hypothetical protein
MKPEKQDLMRDLLDEDSNREATLLAGTRILRRRRHWRTARKGALVLALVAIAAVLALKKENPLPMPQVASIAPQASPVTQVRALSDDELLSLFPNTPVALASLPDGKKRLIFPHPGDEQKFITRL